MKVGAVLLAAGAGSRLGGRPKSLLMLDGVPLIGRAVDALTGAGVAPIVVVLGHYADEIGRALRERPVMIARNATPDDGQPASLRAGMQALPDSLDALDAVIVMLADQPLINRDDINALINAFTQRGTKRMVVPRVNGLPGNPVVIDAALLATWRAGDVNATGRRWRETNPAGVHWFDTDNAHYQVDIDTPADLLRFAERTGFELTWPLNFDADSSAL